MDRLTIRSGSTLPLTTTTPTLHIHLKKRKKKRKTNHTERLVGRTEPGVKGERKGLFCVPSVNLVLKDTQTHVHKATHKHTLTHTHSYLLEGGADLSLCARPTRKRCSALGVFHNVKEPLRRHRQAPLPLLL